MQFMQKKFKDVKKHFKKTRRHMKVAKVGTIARRYFVMNAFDGVLTGLGMILGAFAVGLPDPNFIISAGLGVCVALGLSGVWSAYVAEKAERTRSLKELENAMFTNLKNSLIDRVGKIATIWVAFVNSISPVAAVIITISPFFIVRAGILSIEMAVYSSIAMAMVILFLLGVFLGRTSKENTLVHGAKMAMAGVIVTLILFLMRGIT